MNSETITDHGSAAGLAPGQVARVVVVPPQDRLVEVGGESAGSSATILGSRCGSTIRGRSAD